MRPAVRPPAAEVVTVHPDVRGVPVEVESAPEEWRPAPVPAQDDVDRASLRADLRRAHAERARLAGRIDDLRERVNIPVIEDVEEYQRNQATLAAALDQLDELDAEIGRLRRALER
jgi:transposase